MSKKIRIGLIIISLLTVYPAINAQELWQNTRVGMTVAEVKALYPHALDIEKEPSYVIVDAEDHEKILFLGLLIIEKYQIMNHLFDIHFIFTAEEKELVEVRLICNSDSARRDGHIIFYGLYDEFTNKYGKTISDERTRATGELEGRWHTYWQSGKTIIYISYWYLQQQNYNWGSLSISYYEELTE